MKDLNKEVTVCSNCGRGMLRQHRVYPLLEGKQFYYCEGCHCIVNDGDKRRSTGRRLDIEK